MSRKDITKLCNTSKLKKIIKKQPKIVSQNRTILTLFNDIFEEIGHKQKITILYL